MCLDMRAVSCFCPVLVVLMFGHSSAYTRHGNHLKDGCSCWASATLKPGTTHDVFSHSVTFNKRAKTCPYFPRPPQCQYCVRLDSACLWPLRPLRLPTSLSSRLPRRPTLTTSTKSSVAILRHSSAASRTPIRSSRVQAQWRASHTLCGLSAYRAYRA